MKKLFHAAAQMVCGWLVMLTSAHAGVGVQTDEGPIFNPLNSTNYYYLEYLPVGYDLPQNALREYPLLVFLHGSGETGNGLSDLHKVRRHGPPKRIDDGHDMTFTVGGQSESFIVLSPQQKNGSGGFPGAMLVPLIEAFLQQYRIDPARVYLTGLSMGGKGSWQSAASQENTEAGNLVTAIAPIAASNLQTSYGCALVALSMPVRSFCGDGDPAVSLNACLKAVNAMNNCNADPAPLSEIYPVSSHAQSWQKAYSTDHSEFDPNLYEWLLQQRRIAMIFADGFDGLP